MQPLPDKNLQTKYTVIRLKQPQNQVILQKWINNTSLPFKTSMCRFFLRGMCIVKKQYCKFAHGMNDIMQGEQQPIPKGLLEKEIKKRVVARKSHFNQKALFLCDLNYFNLYQYSLQTNPKSPLSLQQLNTDFDVRNKLRLKFHRHHWQCFIDYIQTHHPNANITIPFLSDLYTKYGFTKPHTHCKLHMLLFWIQQNKYYVRHQVVLPPLVETKTSVIFKRYSKRWMDKMLLKDYEMEKERGEGEENGKREGKMEVDRGRLNEGLIKEYIDRQVVNEKTTICKFYMKGLCLFTEQECKYCHSFDTLNYTYRESTITDFSYFEQKALFSDPKLNYISLYRYQETVLLSNPTYNVLSSDELNKNSNARQQLKEILTNDLYIQFLAKLQTLYPNSRWTTVFLKRQFINSGLNKTKVDRFPAFLDKLQDLNYQIDSFIIPPNLKKKQYIFKRLPISTLNHDMSILFQSIISKRLQIAQPSQKTIIITEPYMRKKFYQFQPEFTIPVHRYLKVRGITLKQYIQQQIDNKQSHCQDFNRISFDLQDNISKIKQSLKQYFNNSKLRQHQYNDMEQYILKNCQQNIRNYIALSGLKWCIVGESLELHKQVYAMPNGDVMICHKKHHNEEEKQCSCKIKGKVEQVELKQEISEQVKQKYQKQRVVIITTQQTLLYSRNILLSSPAIGLDLEGSLREDGFIYLIQMSLPHPITNNPQTFIFDLFHLKSLSSPLLPLTISTIKSITQSPSIVKVMHDCKNDSIALHSLINCCVYPVFDICWMQSYLDMKVINETWREQEIEREQVVRGIMKIWGRCLGLNQVLQKWGKKGNQLKDMMKKMFESGREEKERYFEKRPMEVDWLEYAVRDVEELVGVYEEMVKKDENGVWRQVGLSASTVGLK